MRHTVCGVRALLAADGTDVLESRPISHGTQLRLQGGGVVNVYRTGKALAQGRGAPALAALLDAPAPAGTDAGAASFRTTPEMIAQILATMPPRGPGEAPACRNPAWTDDPRGDAPPF